MKKHLSPSGRLALIYLAIGAAWVLGSDALLFDLITDPHTRNLLQSTKGVFFIGLCAVVIYFVSKKFYRDINRSLADAETLLSKYKALSEASKEGVAEYDFATDTAVINERLKEFLGLEGNEVPEYATRQKAWIHPEDLGRILKSFKETLSSDSHLWQGEYKCLGHDGAYHDVINRGYIIRDKAGRPLRFICTIQDVTHIREMQAMFYEQQLKARMQLGRFIIKAQEDERNRWAGELHDNVCQMLTVVKLYLTELASGRPLPPAVAQQPQVLVENALNEIRQLSASIRPPEFGTISLKEAIEQLVSTIRRLQPYSFHLEMKGLQEENLADQHKLMIYRVVQEQVSNIIKYAQPSNIQIRIENNENIAKMLVVDDGKGFDPAQLNGGIGLRNIQSRLQVFGGNMHIESAPGRGCKLVAEFNLS